MYKTYSFRLLKEKSPFSKENGLVRITSYNVCYTKLLRVKIRVSSVTDEQGVKHYIVHGPLFFAATTSFINSFDVKNDPKEVVISFEESRIMDQSAIEAINKLAEKYQLIGTNVHLRYLSPDCVKLIKKAEKICDVNVLKDPDYHVAINNYRVITSYSIHYTKLYDLCFFN